MGKLPKSKEEWEQSVAEAHSRRQVIKGIIEERGWQTMAELLRILQTEYDIDVTKPTLYHDLDKIAVDSDVAARERLNLLASYKKKINDIEKLISKAKEVKDKIALMKLWTQYGKDYSMVVVRLQSGSGTDKAVEHAHKNRVNIEFEDGVTNNETEAETD